MELAMELMVLSPYTRATLGASAHHLKPDTPHQNGTHVKRHTLTHITCDGLPFRV